jgi:hypothetical protein
VTNIMNFFDRLRLRLESGGTDLSGFSSSLDPPPIEDHVGTKIPQETVEEERKDDDRLTVSHYHRVKPSRDAVNDDGIRQSSAPSPGASIAVSPMRPSRKRASSAGQESDTEPGGALPDEWEITETNREGEVRGGVEGRRCSRHDVWQTARSRQRKRNGVASGSLTLHEAAEG